MAIKYVVGLAFVGSIATLLLILSVFIKIEIHVLTAVLSAHFNSEMNLIKCTTMPTPFSTLFSIF